MNRDDLMALVIRLQEHVAQLSVAIEGLRKENAELRRGGRRQAAPFSKGTRVTDSKRPGRKPGTGTFSYRKSPTADEITEPPVEVGVRGETCAECGGRLKHERVDLAYTTDIPPIPRPKVTKYRVQVCRCTLWGRQVRGGHPDVAPDQYGASAHRVGARAMAAAHVLHYGVGIPVRKVPSVLGVLTGVELTQSAITQDAMRRAQFRVGRAYETLRASVRDSPREYTRTTLGGALEARVPS